MRSNMSPLITIRTCCQDYYKQSPELDPMGPTGGSFGVLRGGSWHFEYSYFGSAGRSGGDVGRGFCVGFRLVRELD